MKEENKENKESKKETPEEFYQRLEKKLKEVEQFPSNFTYKFIIPTSHKKIAEVQQVFDGANPQFNTRESKNGKYTSITVVVYVIDAEQVIYYYKKAGEIEGIMML